MKTLTCLVSLLASLTAAQSQSFVANIDAAQEVPTGGGRTGSGILDLTLSGTTITVSGSFSGLSENSSLAHIHGPAPVGVSTGVLYDFGALSLITLGGTAGTMSGSFNLVPKGAGGSYTVAQQLDDLNNSLWYFNIHSTPNFGGGEIRGQIVPVPEPSTWALFVLGAGGLVWGFRRQTRSTGILPAR